MMVTVFPLCLPAPVTDGYQVQPSDQTIRTDMEAGPARVRRISAAQHDIVQVAWVLTDGEKAAFRAWMYGDPWSLIGPSDDMSAIFTEVRCSVGEAATFAPDGINLAEKIVEDTTADTSHYLNKVVAGVQDNAILSFAASFKAAGRGWVKHVIYNKASSITYANIDLSTGAIGTQSGLVSASVRPQGNGWWQSTIRTNVGTGAANPIIRALLAEANNDTTYTGDGVSGIYMTDLNVRVSDGSDLVLPVDMYGVPVGPAGGAAWFRVRLPLRGIGYEAVEARIVGAPTINVMPGLKWQVSCRLEVR